MTGGVAVAAFTASAVVVVLAGIVLARSGDIIAARTRLGGVWVGTVFLAVATSLPELVTDLSAVRLGVPDLAAGDLFGSSMANMLILALLSLLPGSELFRRAALENALAAALAIVLTAIAALALLTRADVAVLGIGPGSALLAVAYLLGARTLFRHSGLVREAASTAELGDEPTPGSARGVPGIRRAVMEFVAAALAILVAAPLFAASATVIAEMTGLGATFIGTWLVGMATSLPELVTCLAAVRLGAYDLAVGNLFGSNAVNMVMFVPLDIAHPAGPILGAVEPVHAFSALTAIALMALAVAALVLRTRGGPRRVEPAAALMLIGYLAGLALVLAHGTS